MDDLCYSSRSCDCCSNIWNYFSGKIEDLEKNIVYLETIGNSVFKIVGVQKGLSHDQLTLTAVFLGMITATFGGLLRDVLSNEIPMIFRKEIYAIPCLVGGSLYLLGDYFGYGDTLWLLWGSILFIIVFRTLAVLFSWKLPLIREFK